MSQRTYPSKFVDDLLILKSNNWKHLSNCRIAVSKPTVRHDNGKVSLTVCNINKHLSNIELKCIENQSINAQHLG